MAYSIIQAGTDLQFVGTDGSVTTLDLPAAVTLSQLVPPRWLVSGHYVILVNSSSLPVTIDGRGVVRLLAPRAPRLGPVLSGVSGGTLSGTYFSRYTFVVFDEFGNLISESDYSPISNTATITTDFLNVANLDVSPDEISGRRIYRTTTDGAVLFQWIDLDGNVLTSVQDDLSDAGLSLFASPTLGSVPYLTNIAEFRGRLFGVPGDDPDYLRYTEAGLRYSWPSDNLLPIQPIGSDEFGVTALLPRRDALGVGRKNQLWQIVGDGSEVDGIADLSTVRISEILGVLGQESVDIYRDTAYFLWYDGVYQWNSDGVRCISDGEGGKGNVRSWFATDDYFNRSRFPYAFGKVDPIRNVYKLFLAEADSDEEDRWVEFDISNRTWWGPHKTQAFTPRSIFAATDTSGLAILAPSIGSDEGDIYQEQETRTDGENFGIEFDVVTKRHATEEVDATKYFGQLTVIGRKQAEGTDVTITSRVGELDLEDANAKTVEHLYDTGKSSNLLKRLGAGTNAELEFVHDIPDADVEIFAYQISPVNIVGSR